MSQTINSGVTANTYMISADVAGVHSAGQIYLIVKSGTEELTKVDLGEGTSWDVWATVSDVFEISADDAENSIVVSIEGTLEPTDQTLVLDNVELTLALPKLQALYAEAESVKASGGYTQDSLDALGDAMTTAKGVIDNAERTNSAINSAYAALKDALDNMVIDKVLEITFNYFADGIDADDEPAVVVYNDSISFSEGTKEADWEEEYLPWDNAKCYLMEKSGTYDGWYSIGIKVTNVADTSAGFEIHSKKGELFKCAAQWNHTEIYKQLISGEADTYAVKKFGDGSCSNDDNDPHKLYAGDAATTAMRNVTFYAYSEAGTPYIVLSADLDLEYIDEETGVKSVYEADDEAVDGTNKGYEMKEDSYSGWYYLTFSVPDTASTADTVFKLYVKEDGGTYTWKKNFLNGAAGNEWNLNVMPVFTGSVYYKDGELSDSRVVAITLGMLRELIEEAEEIFEEGSEKYTNTTWEAFTEALEAAKGLAEALTDKDDSCTDEDIGEETEGLDITITDAYNNLEKAKDGLKEKGRTITFSYYAGDTNGKGVGIYKYAPKGNISSEANIPTWKAWGTESVYEMTPEKYPGWYTIDLTFTGEESDNANFQVFIEGANASVFKCGGSGSNESNRNETIYKELFTGTETTYAVKLFGATVGFYKGEAEVNTAMRSVTLYVYSADTEPYIGSASELSTINESTGAVDKLTASSNTKPDTDSNHYYKMTSVSDLKGWYSLTFSAPVPAEGSNEICGLYTYADSTYTLVKKFLSEEATGVTDSVDFSPVFEGNVYYKDGEFYADPVLAEGITLKMLEDYLESDEVTDIYENGEEYYTYDSWNAFDTAWSAADALVNGYRDSTDKNSDDYKDTAITEAYIALQDAINNMKERPKEITFYYYNDSLHEGDEFGLYFWNGEDSYSTSERTDTRTDASSKWGAWSNPTYALSPEDEYPGWYSISMVFGSNNNGFAIHTKNASTTPTATYSVGDGNYPNLEILKNLKPEEAAYAVKNGKYYYGKDLVTNLRRNVTLYVYDKENAPVLGTNNAITAYVDESTASKVEVPSIEHKDDVYYYELKDAADDIGKDNWYSIRFSAPAAGDNKEIGKLYTKNESTYDPKVTFIEGETTDENTVNLAPYFGKTIYYKDGGFYDSVPVTLEDLRKLIEEAETLRDEDLAAADKDEPGNKYLHSDDGGKWDAFVAQIDDAKAVAEMTDPAPTGAQIQTAYNSLETAMKELVLVPQKSETISVKRVALSDEFITGADLSSYVSLKESGVVFKDREGNALSDAGFFKMLYEGGTNWVRIRIWNDPYDSNGNGYGGGNSDLAKAKVIGKLATDAGMRVLIDFHYSDFWADPSKQDAPKAWEDYSIDEKVTAVKKFTLDSLNELRAAGVDVGMVQVGNETNNAICGERTWTNMAKIFTAGSAAVKEFDEECLVAIHFADPSSSAFTGYASKLNTYGVDYDVFAASYYPFWHGKAENMHEVLGNIAKGYDKKVMVVETSWVTTWEDGDGHSNTSPKTTQTLNYPVSVQGQADEIRDVVDKVSSIGDSAIGVFYWEPAWISPYYVYNGTTIDQSLYSKNKEAWEKYGSGWASSYAIEYDPVDAGQWYGGSAVDNQAWFDFNGQALDTAYIYSYIRTGAEATGRVNAIANVESEIELKVNVGDTIVWPGGDDIVVTYNDGSKAPDYNEDGTVKKNDHHISTTVEWDEDQVKLVNTDNVAVFAIDGIATCKYRIKDGEEDNKDNIKTETYDITLTIEVLSTGNILANPGFENGGSWTPWNLKLSEQTEQDIKNATIAHVKTTDEDPHSGSWGMHFWNKENPINFSIEQEIAEIEPGIYTAGGFLQGNGASSKDLQTLYVIVKDLDGKEVKYEKTCSLNGWLNWVNPEITNIKVSEGDTVTVGMEIVSTVGGAWGTIDDMYLYGKYGVNLGDIEHGTVNVSNMEPNTGEIVRISAMPENGYYLSTLKLSGANVAADALIDDSKLTPGTSYDVGSKEVTLTYNAADYKTDETILSHFIMPEGAVTLEAEFKEISFTEPVSIDNANVTVKDFEFKEELDGKYVYKYDQEYTGKKIELDLELSYAGYKLTSADYTAKYNNNIKKTDNSSMAEITITAKGRKFTGRRTLYFKIVDTKVDISKAKAALVVVDGDPNKVDTYYYTGAEIEPAIDFLTDKNGNKLTKDGSELTVAVNEDYTVYYQKNINVGKATMTVIAKSESANIKGSFTQTFTIAKRPITDSSITVSGISGAVYTGSKVTPNVTVKYNNKVLQKGKDYTVTYKNNVNVSADASAAKKPSLKITGKGNYTGTTAEYPFVITPKNISDHGIRVTADDIAEGKAPKITVKNGTKTLSLNKQYRITMIRLLGEDESLKDIIEEFDKDSTSIIYLDDDADGTPEKGKKPTDKISEAGTYAVRLNGILKGGYDGENWVSFRVIDKDHLMSNYKITLPKTMYYTGSEIELSTESKADDPNTEDVDEAEEAELKVTDKIGNIPLVKGTDYEVSYEDVNGNKTNIKVGTATVTITGKGNYAGTKTAKFKIAKRTVSKPNPDSSDDEKAAIRYEIKEDTLLDKVAKNTAAGETLYLPYTGYAWTPELDIYATNNGVNKLLTKGVDYTITYKNNLKPGASASIIVKGKGNYSGTVPFDNVFTVKDVTLNDFVITVNPAEYAGKAIKPALTFVYKATGTEIAVKSGTAYGVKYTNNKNVASIESSIKPTVTITEKGMNAGKKGAEKNKLDIPFTITTARIKYTSVSDIKVQTYNGKPVKPKLTIKVNGKSLKEGTDYVVTYTGNTRPNDKAKANIIGIGNYSGLVTKEFVIK
ncbi:MAG: glycosyl hydrolase 53 family protein [Lachnospiraceae bacterium]|nr:glycosyl hydrolase 53 family protein [Lachnospiraceae bacterium]